MNKNILSPIQLKIAASLHTQYMRGFSGIPGSILLELCGTFHLDLYNDLAELYESQTPNSERIRGT